MFPARSPRSFAIHYSMAFLLTVTTGTRRYETIMFVMASPFWRLFLLADTAYFHWGFCSRVVRLLANTKGYRAATKVFRAVLAISHPPILFPCWLPATVSVLVCFLLADHRALYLHGRGVAGLTDLADDVGVVSVVDTGNGSNSWVLHTASAKVL